MAELFPEPTPAPAFVPVVLPPPKPDTPDPPPAAIEEPAAAVPEDDGYEEIYIVVQLDESVGKEADFSKIKFKDLNTCRPMLDFGKGSVRIAGKIVQTIGTSAIFEVETRAVPAVVASRVSMATASADPSAKPTPSAGTPPATASASSTTTARFMTESTRHMEFAPKRPRLIPRANPKAEAKQKEAAKKKAALDASTAVALAAAQAAASLLLEPTVDSQAAPSSSSSLPLDPTVVEPAAMKVEIIDDDDEPVAGASA